MNNNDDDDKNDKNRHRNQMHVSMHVAMVVIAPIEEESRILKNISILYSNLPPKIVY